MNDGLHTEPNELALYLQGELDPSRALQIEAHANECIRCAALMQEEAVFEKQLNDAAKGLKPLLAQRVRRGRLWGAVALAAVAVLLLGVSILWRERAHRPENVATPMTREQLDRVDQVTRCLEHPERLECARGTEGEKPPPPPARVERVTPNPSSAP